MSEKSSKDALASVVESVYLKLVARVGMPGAIVLLGYFGSMEVSKITDALNVIPQLVSDQKITGLKIDQMQKDMSQISASVYTKDEAAKDWKIQDQRDQLLDASLQDHEKRLEALEIPKK